MSRCFHEYTLSYYHRQRIDVKFENKQGKNNTSILAFLRKEGVTKLTFAKYSKEVLEEAHSRRNS